MNGQSWLGDQILYVRTILDIGSHFGLSDNSQIDPISSGMLGGGILNSVWPDAHTPLIFIKNKI